jgi:hypothetical protein
VITGEHDKEQALAELVLARLQNVMDESPPYIGVQMDYVWNGDHTIASIRIRFFTEMTYEMLDRMREGLPSVEEPFKNWP